MFLDDNTNNNENLSKALLILEKDEKINYSLSTHADIDKLSFYKEREVLFFPFSTFEVKKVKETEKKNEKVYEIKLIYLGKYLKEVENNLNNSKQLIPDSKFKNEIIDFGLIEKEKVDIEIKELIENFQKYKEKINENDKNEESLKSNCIFSEVIINEANINQNIRVINTYEEMIKSNKGKKIKAKYNNENEIKENCEIKIKGTIIDFSYFYEFEKEGTYKIK